jgi:hypothetical protein
LRRLDWRYQRGITRRRRRRKPRRQLEVALFGRAWPDRQCDCDRLPCRGIENGHSNACADSQPTRQEEKRPLPSARSRWKENTHASGPRVTATLSESPMLGCDKEATDSPIVVCCGPSQRRLDPPLSESEYFRRPGILVGARGFEPPTPSPPELPLTDFSKFQTSAPIFKNH